MQADNKNLSQSLKTLVMGKIAAAMITNERTSYNRLNHFLMEQGIYNEESLNEIFEIIVSTDIRVIFDCYLESQNIEDFSRAEKFLSKWIQKVREIQPK